MLFRGEFIFHLWVEKWPNLIPEFHLEEMGGISRGTIKLIWSCKCKGVSFRQTVCASLCDTFTQLSRRILFFFSLPCLSPHLFCSLSLYCVGVCQKPWQVEHQMKLTDCWHLHSKCAWIKCSRQGLLFYFSAEVWWIMKQPQLRVRPCARMTHGDHVSPSLVATHSLHVSYYARSCPLSSCCITREECLRSEVFEQIPWNNHFYS